MLVEALRAEADDYVERHRGERDEDGRALVVRNGLAQARKLRLGTETVKLKAPRIDERRYDEQGGRRRFTSLLLPPHTVHCGPDAIYISAPGDPKGDGPGGIFLLDCESFDVLGRWEVDRGPQFFAYDFWWHLGWDVAITGEWGTPNMFENGLVPDLLLGNKYGHSLHIWNLRNRRHLKVLDLGPDSQQVFELRPSHDPTNTYGFVGVVISTKDLSGSIWLWYRDAGEWKARKVIEIPAEPADESQLPPALKPFKAVPPLVSDINRSLDDKFLYVACWGTGDLKQYDVSDPFNPKLAGTVRLGGIGSHAKHPKSGPLNGGTQMIELSRDGRRVRVEFDLRSVGCAILS
jgi:methanethiol oxidase